MITCATTCSVKNLKYRYAWVRAEEEDLFFFIVIFFLSFNPESTRATESTFLGWISCAFFRSLLSHLFSDMFGNDARLCLYVYVGNIYTSMCAKINSVLWLNAFFLFILLFVGREKEKMERELRITCVCVRVCVYGYNIYLLYMFAALGSRSRVKPPLIIHAVQKSYS